MNSTIGPYDQRAFRPLEPTASWLSHLTQACMRACLMLLIFYALAQASDFRFERRQVVSAK